MIHPERIRTAILAQLAADLELQVRAANLAREEATSEESKAENKYDTRAQEAAYLAEAQARQAAEIQESLTLYQNLALPARGETVSVGHVIDLTAGERTVRYFLGPRAGGLELRVEDEQITVVTPASPLGAQLLGRKLGETVTLPARPRPLAYRISALG